MPEQLPTTLIGCLLDVSGSMRETLESNESEERPVDRLHAVLRAALNIARTEVEKDLHAVMFVGAFGLNRDHGRPPAIDLCSVADSLLQNHDNRTGHDRLIELSNENNLAHITEYIREKFTNNTAGIVHAYLQRHPERITEFVEVIPTPEQLHNMQRQSETAQVGGSALLSAVGALMGTAVEDMVVDSSEALQLAHRICTEWLLQFTDFIPRPAREVVHLLQRLTEPTTAANGAVIDSLDEFMYGNTPLRYALEQSLAAFRAHPVTSQRVLLLVSDGFSTDGSPVPLARKMEEERVIIAGLYLTKEKNIPQRRLYDRIANSWNQGQRTLFNIATVVPVTKHPIPVLTSVGWSIPSSGECSLYASACSTTAVNEFCSLLVSAQLGCTDALLDIIGRLSLDKYIDDEHIKSCKNPSDQKGASTCYAHATAAVIHMALLRIVRRGVCPSIAEIRKRILCAFPDNGKGRVTEEVLKKATSWYGLRYRQVDETGARQAVLHRRPVLASFRLSRSGWRAFYTHFTAAASRSQLLTSAQMRQHPSDPDDEGHAVVLFACTPHSLSFLNSWGYKWGNNGTFSVESTAALERNGPPDRTRMRFYDIFWYESDLKDEERQAYKDGVDEKLHTRSAKHPALLELEAQCPLCEGNSLIANFTGTTRQATCPHCSQPFQPQPGYLVQALYARAGLGNGVDMV
ncbi:hypothetical protein BDW59DRAFT_171381 [Aspergillus cavernicola]|uniref:VWFA domain-containing protein n=1 Tax=Aspergillus cavernicola TaxID=176166 RepID=A0ABR4IHW7_9EURO